jgi:hypothetical protein
MTNEQKIEKLKVLISPDTATDSLLLSLLELAEGIVLNRRYPFGAPEGATVEQRFENVQLQIAVELFSKMGAEGQTAHKENGIERTYAAADVSPSLIRRITPVVGSVM